MQTRMYRNVLVFLKQVDTKSESGEKNETGKIGGKAEQMPVIDPAQEVKENCQFEFLSESRLKSTGSIKSDGSVSQYNGYVQQEQLADTPQCEHNSVCTNASVIGEKSSLHSHASSHAERNVQPNSPLVLNSDAEQSDPFAEGSKCTNTKSLRSGGEIGVYKGNRFGAVGEPCPAEKLFRSAENENISIFSQDSFEDFSKLKLGDGDRLLNPNDSDRELFGPKSHWKEPSYFGYGWLDGLSQLVSAQEDLVQTENVEKVMQNYPVFGLGGDYEVYKKKLVDEQWQQKQMGIQHDYCCSGEPVGVDQDKASTLIPQHLLDQSLYSRIG